MAILRSRSMSLATMAASCPADVRGRTLSVSPRRVLQLEQSHTRRGDESSELAITRVQLDGSLRADVATSSLEVVSGTSAITTNPAEYEFSATAGRCVSAADEGLSVGSCELAQALPAISAPRLERLLERASRL